MLLDDAVHFKGHADLMRIFPAHNVCCRLYLSINELIYMTPGFGGAAASAFLAGFFLRLYTFPGPAM